MLGNYFNNFTLAYINNILVFLFGLKKYYLKKVYKVIERLTVAKFYLDSKKYKFAIRSVNYFGLIIIISVGIQADPKKIKAIID